MHEFESMPDKKKRSKVPGRIQRADSKLLVGFGAVPAKRRPENFQALRKQLEQGVAEEVLKEHL